MKMITVDIQINVATVKLNRGITNALNLQLINELIETLQGLKHDDVRGLVLSSSNEKFFSIGFDIPYLFDLDREDFAHFYHTFNDLCLDLYTFPRPTVAALTGHAVAGGCILSLCCDYRFIAEGKKLMGLNEIKLGVPMPYLVDTILRSIVGLRFARDVTDTGDFYTPDESLRMGLVDQVLPLEDVLPQSLEKAKIIGSSPQEAFRQIKRNRVETVEERFRERRQKKEQIFVDRWFSDDTRRRLREAMEKF